MVGRSGGSHPGKAMHRTESGREAGISAKRSVCTLRLGSAYASGIAYAPHGAIASYNIGDATNNFVVSLGYNSKTLAPIWVTANKPGAASLAWYFCYATSGCPTDTSNPDQGTSSTDNGNLRSQRIVAGGLNLNQTYDYDALNRIGSVTEGAWTRSFDYDRYGNMWSTQTGAGGPPVDSFTPSSSSSYNAANNRLTNAALPIHYEAEESQNNGPGLLTQIGQHTYTYDTEGRIKTVAIAGNTVAVYDYDGDGRRVKQVKTAGTTLFAYDASGNLAAEYSTETVPATPPTTYPLLDHLGSIRAEVPENGSMQQTTLHDYLPFGEELLAGRTAAWGGMSGIKLRFTGKERDTETGLDYFGARYFSSAQGRFTSPDPSHDGVRMDNPQTWNRYSYVLDNPLELTDPTGELWNVNGKSVQWVDKCGHADQCIQTVALADENGVTVYGTDGASDVTRYDANDTGMVDMRTVAKNDDAQFVVNDQPHPEPYLNPSSAAAFYNAAASYRQTHPKDDKLGFNHGSTPKGKAAIGDDGNPIHLGHKGGRSVDLRYMGTNGKQLTGPSAYSAGDRERNREIINSMAAGGLGGAITGDAKKYGSKPVSEALRRVHKDHIHLETK
jgi:RHS repeat-associated protein